MSNYQKRKTRRGGGTVNSARLVAAEVLIEVDAEGKFANLVLRKALRQRQTEDPNFTFRDSALTSELVYGTIRQQSFLDFALSPHCSQPLEDLDAAVLICLRLGAYQLLFLRVAEHAAVSETVEVARKLAGEGPSRFVNAVLRSLQREGKQETFERVDQIEDRVLRTATKYSHPEWIVTDVRDALVERGIDVAELDGALAANNEAAKVTLVARPGLITPAELAQEAEDVLGTSTAQGLLSEYAVVLSGGDPGALPSVRSGVAAVQDEGSQLAAMLLAEAPLEGSDKRWLDLCAGPGGKSALLGAIGASRGVELVANEVNPKRARLVGRSVQALENVSVNVGDGRSFTSDAPFDRTLVDAPCLGLGSLRRRPESRWRHSRADLDELLPLQEALLSQGIALTRKGGVVAWVTCSPHVAETLDQVAYALDQFDVELIDAADLAQTFTPVDLALGSGSEIASKTVQLWPHHHGTDAMFIALLRKK